MKTFKSIIKEFDEALDSLSTSEQSQLKRSIDGIELCNQTLSSLKKKIEQRDFESIPEEINFFKNIKPHPMSYLIYFTEVRSCELQKPKAGLSYQTDFLEREIVKINKFFYQNIDFAHYMELGYTYLDHQFFSRTHRVSYPISPFTDYYQYPEFSTSHDMLWSKIKAMNHFIHFIRESMEALQPGSTKKHLEEKKHRVLIWTASKTALTELIYALYSDNVLNHGGADLKTITTSFEEFFNVKLDQIYKTYAEIKERKGSRTKFLDELMLKLSLKMDREDLA